VEESFGLSQALIGHRLLAGDVSGKLLVNTGPEGNLRHATVRAENNRMSLSRLPRTDQQDLDVRAAATSGAGHGEHVEIEATNGDDVLRHLSHLIECENRMHDSGEVRTPQGQPRQAVFQSARTN
jgi:hypothetical protein